MRCCRRRRRRCCRRMYRIVRRSSYITSITFGSRCVTMADVRQYVRSFIISLHSNVFVMFLFSSLKMLRTLLLLTNNAQQTACLTLYMRAPHTYFFRVDCVFLSLFLSVSLLSFIHSFFFSFYPFHILLLFFSLSLKIKFIQSLHEANKMLNLGYKFKQVQMITVSILLYRNDWLRHIYLFFLLVWKFVQFRQWPLPLPPISVNNYEIFDTGTSTSTIVTTSNVHRSALDCLRSFNLFLDKTKTRRWQTLSVELLVYFRKWVGRSYRNVGKLNRISRFRNSILSYRRLLTINDFEHTRKKKK